MFGIEQSVVTGLGAYTLGREAIEMRKARREAMKRELSQEDFEKWEKAELEERRHQDICNAIRATKPDQVKCDDGLGIGGLLFAAYIGASIARD